MLSYSTSFSLWWTTVALLFVLSINMNMVNASASSSSTLSDVINIVGSKDVGRNLNDRLVAGLADGDVVEHNNNQQVCACQPTWYTLKLNRSLDCDDRTIFTGQTPRIQSVVCTHPQDKTATALTAISTVTGRPFVPTLINTVIIKELDRQGRILKQETIQGPFPDGTEITYISILATASPATKNKATTAGSSTSGGSGSHHHQSSTPLPSRSPSLHNDMVDKGGDDHNSDTSLLPVRLEVKFLGYPGGSVWSMAYSQDCLGGPILEKGHTIVRAVLSDVGSPAAGFCPVLPEAVGAPLIPTKDKKKTMTTAKNHPSTRLTTLRLPQSTTIPMVFVMSSTKMTNSTNSSSSSSSIFQHEEAVHAMTKSFQKLLHLRPVRDLIILTRQ